jgi:hypothetical protein
MEQQHTVDWIEWLRAIVYAQAIRSVPSSNWSKLFANHPARLLDIFSVGHMMHDADGIAEQLALVARQEFDQIFRCVGWHLHCR